jgi:hypothetical protein
VAGLGDKMPPGARIFQTETTAYLFSAKGATFSTSPPQDGFRRGKPWGSALGFVKPKTTSALKARFTSVWD